jgi:hypothetical protein
VWNLETLDTVRAFTRLADFVTAVSLSDDGRLAAAGLLNGEVADTTVTSPLSSPAAARRSSSRAAPMERSGSGT